jgi:glyoxylase-like metal-dependent hydrolase (beta-lactamase superfamily II)
MNDKCTRRSFIAGTAGCGAHLFAMLAAAPAVARSRFGGAQKGVVVAEEAFGRLERLGDGVWGLISTPLRSRTTLSNGGIVAGSDGVLVILGSRRVRVSSRRGHTPSDLTIEVDDPRVVFCGDLVRNEMLPNYMDAIPTRLADACRDLLADRDAICVPGHGALADYEETRKFLALIDDVGAAARNAFERGVPLAEAGAEYEVPAELGEWFMFSPRYYEVAFGAWYKELG